MENFNGEKLFSCYFGPFASGVTGATDTRQPPRVWKLSRYLVDGLRRGNIRVALEIPVRTTLIEKFALSL